MARHDDDDNDDDKQLYPVMVNGIRTVYNHGLNKGFGWKFYEVSLVCQETPEESQKKHRPKRCEYNNKEEDNDSEV